jgi:hypothetical protein
MKRTKEGQEAGSLKLMNLCPLACPVIASRSEVVDNRLYKFADFMKSAFQNRGLQRDQPENDAAGSQPDDGFVLHVFIATMRQVMANSTAAKLPRD